MTKTFFLTGTLFGFLAVSLGAFGAHALKSKLSTEMLSVFETGVRYQMYHALALLMVAWASAYFHSNWTNAAGWFFIFGVIIFSGSLYTLSLTGVRIWGAVTPIGGLLFLAGWFSLFLTAVTK